MSDPEFRESDYYGHQLPPAPQQQPPPSGPYPQPYGQQPQPYQQYQPQPMYTQPAPYVQPYGYVRTPQQDQGLAVASLVCSLIGIFFCIPSILGIVFGHVAYSKAKRGEAGGQGMAQAGMIIGYVIVALWTIPLLLWLVFGIAVLGAAGLA